MPRLPDVSTHVPERHLTVERRAAQARRIPLVDLPRPYVEDFDPQDVLEALIEAITEELSEEELAACSDLPIGQDPVYWLIRKYFADEMTLDQCGRLYGVTRERIRQIESKALARKAVVLGLLKHAEEGARAIDTRELRAEATNERIRHLLQEGASPRAICQALLVPLQLVHHVKRELAKEAA